MPLLPRFKTWVWIIDVLASRILEVKNEFSLRLGITRCKFLLSRVVEQAGAFNHWRLRHLFEQLSESLHRLAHVQPFLNRPEAGGNGMHDRNL